MWQLLLSQVTCNTTTLTVGEFYQFAVKEALGEKKSLSPKDYADAFPKFVVIQTADGPYPSRYKTVKVIGEPTEIENIKQLVSTNHTAPDENLIYVSFHKQRKEATYSQQGLLFIPIIAIVILLAAALYAIIMWLRDDYAHDPANSLLFVTEGSRIISGQ